MRPTLFPTKQPIGQPSLVPTKQPRRRPTGQPFGTPTSHPSTHPTARPTGYPIQVGIKKTPRPSKPPSFSPSASPTTPVTRWEDAANEMSRSYQNLNTSSIFYQELSVSGALVGGGCSEYHSFLTGDFASTNVLQFPVSLRMETITDIFNPIVYSSICNGQNAVSAILNALINPLIGSSTIACNGNLWMIKWCGAAISPSLCVNCSDPCSLYECSRSNPFNIGPCSSSGSCPSIASSIHALRIDFKNRFSVPSIGFIGVNASATTLTLSIGLSSSGFVYCAAFNVYEYPTKVSNILALNNFGVFSGQLVSIVISGLIPATKYNVYCATKNFYGNVMPFTEVLEGSFEVETYCCPVVHVSLAVKYVIKGSSIPDVISINLDTPPPFPLHILVSLVTIEASNTLQITPLSPEKIILRDISTYSLPLTTLNTVKSGICYVNITILNGLNYVFNFEGGRSNFTIIDSPQLIPAPVPVSAIFSDDGYSVQILFDSDTNTANFQSTIFYCSQLLSFKAISNVQCQWSTPSVLAVLLPAFSSLVPKDVIEVLGNKIMSNSVNSSKFTVHANLSLQYPLNPVKPAGVINIPSTVNRCSFFSTDIVSSTGSGNRRWANVSFAVHSSNVTLNSSVYALQTLLNTRFFDYSRPIEVPANLLQVGQYSLFVTLCNFLSVCGFGSISFDVRNVDVPVVSIAGSLTKYMKSQDSLVITASVALGTCSAAAKTEQFGYLWQVYLNGVSQPFIHSVSPILSTFQLNPYSLTSNSVYSVKLSVSFPSVVVQTEVVVNVLQSNIVAVIDGVGSSGVINAGSYLILNGSTSYDEGISQIAANGSNPYKNFIYKWSCLTVYPTVNLTCALTMKLSSNNSPYLSVYAPAQMAGKTVKITLQVLSGNRTNSASVELSVLASQDRSVRIISPPQITAMTNEKIKINGTVRSTSDGISLWSVNDTSVDLATVLLTPVQQFWQPSGYGSQYIPVSMVLRANALSANAFYSFSLTYSEIGGISMTASVVVRTNGIPVPGFFSILPSRGIAMADEFRFTCSFWSDANLPLTYVFSFQYGGVFQALNTASEQTFESYLLPAGLDSLNYSLPCKVTVYNSLGANNSASKSIQVFRNSNFQDLSFSNSFITTALSNALSSGDKASLQYSLATGGAIVNVVECAGAPLCSTLGRFKCAQVNNTCGNCFPGFIGESGNKNTMCYNSSQYSSQGSSVRLRRLADAAPCATNNDCQIFEVCENSFCVSQSQQCANGCNGRGTCGYQTVSSGSPLTECLVSDPNCMAVCHCSASFGSSCSYLSIQDLLLAQKTRLSLLRALQNETMFPYLYPSDVTSQLATLVALTSVPDEISSQAITIANNILTILIRNAVLFQLSYEDLVAVAGLVDNLLQAAISVSAGNTRTLSTFLNLELSVLSSFIDAVFSDMIYGQNGYQIVLNNIRYQIAATSFSSISLNSYALSSPASLIESFVGTQQSSAVLSNLNSGRDLMVSGFEVTPRGLSIDSLSISSPFFLQINNGNKICGKCQLALVVRNRRTQKYIVENTKQQFTTQCVRGVTNYHNYKCYNGFVMRSICNGSFAGSQITVCPSNLTEPACNVRNALTARAATCSTIVFSNGSTSCSCDLSSVVTSDSFSTVISATSQKTVYGTNGSSYYIPNSGAVPSSSSAESKLVESLYSYRFVIGGVGILVLGVCLLCGYWAYYFAMRTIVDVSELQKNLKAAWETNSSHRFFSKVPSHVFDDNVAKILKGPPVLYISPASVRHAEEHLKKVEKENSLWEEYYEENDSSKKKKIIHVTRLTERVLKDPSFLLSEKGALTEPQPALASSAGSNASVASVSGESRSRTEMYVDVEEREGHADAEAELSVSDIYPSVREHREQAVTFNNEFYLRSVEKTQLTINITLDVDDSTVSGSVTDRHSFIAEQIDLNVVDQSSIPELKKKMEVDDKGMDDIDGFSEMDWNGLGGNEEIPENDDDIFFPLRKLRIISSDAQGEEDVEEHKAVDPPVLDTQKEPSEVHTDIVVPDPDEQIPAEAIVNINETITIEVEHEPSEIIPLPQNEPSITESSVRRKLVLSPHVLSSAKDLNKSKSKKMEIPIPEPFRVIGTSPRPSSSPRSQRIKGNNKGSDPTVHFPFEDTSEGLQGQGEPTEFQDWMRLDFNPNATLSEQPQAAVSRYLKPTKSSHSKTVATINRNTNSSITNNNNNSSNNENTFSSVSAATATTTKPSNSNADIGKDRVSGSRFGR